DRRRRGSGKPCAPPRPQLPARTRGTVAQNPTGGNMALKTHPAVRATMLIRRPVGEVFNAFVDPSVTCRFWFSRASGPLAPGTTVTWYWDQYGVSGEVKVTAFEENRRIAIEWPSPVEWSFIPRGDSATFVSIVATGF